MTLKNEILTFLLDQLNESEVPWVTEDELLYILGEKGKKVSRKELSSIIDTLHKDGYLEVKTVSPGTFDRGFIVRLTIQGRNLFVYGIPSLTGS